jgi:quercetin dioxygenase-like cupin family protein
MIGYRRIPAVIAVLLVALAGPPSAYASHQGRAHALPKGSLQYHGRDIAWRDAPSPMPEGVEMAVLEGNPRAAGLFTLRLRVPRGTVIEPHWHPKDERVTVLAGKVGVGFGEVFDKDRLRYFEPGSYYLNPAGSRHYVHFARDSEVQVTGFGPWEVHYLDSRRRR